MKTQVFVPLYDELMYEHPERIRGPIMAFDPESIRVFRDDQSCDADRQSDKGRAGEGAREDKAAGRQKGKSLAELGFRVS